MGRTLEFSASFEKTRRPFSEGRPLLALFPFLLTDRHQRRLPGLPQELLRHTVFALRWCPPAFVCRHDPGPRVSSWVSEASAQS